MGRLSQEALSSLMAEICPTPTVSKPTHENPMKLTDAILIHGELRLQGHDITCDETVTAIKAIVGIENDTNGGLPETSQDDRVNDYIAAGFLLGTLIKAGTLSSMPHPETDGCRCRFQGLAPEYRVTIRRIPGTEVREEPPQPG